jgi:FkbM family methyltransferase
MVEYKIAENEYGKYAVPINVINYDGLSRSLLNGLVWEEKTVRYIIDNCGSGSIIHAGTFIGDFLPALGKTGNYVLAFEPVYESFWCAQETIRLNFGEDHNIHLFNYGLGDVSSSRRIRNTDFRGIIMAGRARYMDESLPDSDTEETTIVTLDEMVIQEGRRFDEFSIIHLDIEGFEERAVKGAINIIRESTPHLILECWNRKLFDSDFFKKEIFSLGYEIKLVLNEHGDDNIILSVH